MESAQARREAHIHYIAAFVGGWLGLFPLVNASHLFGSAQTINLTELVIQIIGANGPAVLFHALGLFLYAFAIFLVTILQKKTRLDVRYLALLIDAVVCVVMWLFPTNKDIPLLFYLYPTFFAMPFQWCAFAGAYGYKNSTIFSSNNVRQFVSALTEVLCGDKSFALKAIFMGATLLGVYLGVIAGWLCWCFFDNTGFLFALVPILCATILLLTKPQ